jgi:hypothetical protein
VTPEPYELALIALASARLWKLVGDDRVLDRPRDWLMRKLESPDGRPFRRGGAPRATYWGDFLVCPWCAGFWCSLLMYGGWIAFGPGKWESDELLMAGISVFAISALVGLFGVLVDALQHASD